MPIESKNNPNIDRLLQKFGNKYNYDEFIYINSKTKGKIVCNNCGTSINRTLKDHFHSEGKCLGCINKTINIDFEKKYGDRYILLESSNSNLKPLTIQCRDCNSISLYSMRQIKKLKELCHNCGSYRTMNWDRLQKKLNSKYEHKFTFSKEPQTTDKYIDAYCKETHKKKISYLLHKTLSCECRVNYCFKYTKPAIMYYIKIEKENATYYKVGITNSNLKVRFASDFKYIVDSYILHYPSGKEAHEHEQFILKKYAESKLPKGIKVLVHRGNTEIFTEDVLGWFRC